MATVAFWEKGQIHGKIRELENTIEYAAAMTTRDVIVEDLFLQSRTIQESKVNSLKKAKNQFEVNYTSKGHKLRFSAGYEHQ